MKKVGKRALALFLATTLCMGAFAGCSKSKNVEKGEKTDSTAKTAVQFPLKEKVKLTYWMAFSNPVLKSLGESELYKELMKRTNIEIEFLHPPEGQSKEQLNIIIASRDIPDIIEGGLAEYSGGATKAYDDGVIAELSELQKKYAPNISDIYSKYPEILTSLKTDQGYILQVPHIRGDASLLTSRGPEVRKDWLKDLNMNAPETIDEWYTMLKAFKEKKGAVAPITGILNDLKTPDFVAGWNTKNDYYLEKGKVVFGPITPNFKEYVTTIAKWYKEGLIDSEMPTNNAKIVDSRMTNNQSGVMLCGYAGSTIGRLLGLMEKKDPKFDMTGIQYPVQKKGDIPFFVHVDPVVNINKAGAASISATSKHQMEAMALLDYGFSKEGHMLFNFGIEGVSYKLENNYPKYTEVITKDPDGNPFATIASKYMRSHYNGPMVQDPKYLEQYWTLQQQKDSYNVWSKYQKNYIEANRDMKGTLTTEENSRYASIMSEVNTYKDEMYLKWLMGQESTNNYDAYVAQLKKMGIEEAIKIKQAAYDRFLQKFPEAANPKAYNVNDYYTK